VHKKNTQSVKTLFALIVKELEIKKVNYVSVQYVKVREFNLKMYKWESDLQYKCSKLVKDGNLLFYENIIIKWIFLEKNIDNNNKTQRFKYFY
jgi:hypothetical protein